MCFCLPNGRWYLNDYPRRGFKFSQLEMSACSTGATYVKYGQLDLDFRGRACRHAPRLPLCAER